VLHYLEKGVTRWAQTGAVLARGLVVWSVVVIGLACATHSGYPEELIHPFFQMTLPLAWAGFFPHSLGTMMGWSRQVSSVVPLGAVVVAVLWTVFAGRRVPGLRAQDLFKAAGSLLTAALIILVMGGIVQHTAASTHRLAWIMDTVWEPRMTTENKRPDPVKQQPGFGSRPVRQDERNHVGRHHARTGDPARALELFVQGVSDGAAGRK